MCTRIYLPLIKAVAKWTLVKISMSKVTLMKVRIVYIATCFNFKHTLAQINCMTCLCVSLMCHWRVIGMSLMCHWHVRVAFHMHALWHVSHEFSACLIWHEFARLQHAYSTPITGQQIGRTNACLKFEKVEFLGATNSSLAIDTHRHAYDTPMARLGVL